MGAIFALMMLLFFMAAAMGGIYLLYQLILNFQPGGNKIRSDLEKLRAEMAPWFADLVPWDDKDDIELLSLNQINKSVKGGLGKTIKGVFTSIYHEPMIAYAYRRYLSSGENAVLYARTQHHEFLYRIRPKEVQISIDNQYLGTLNEKGQLIGARNNRLLAQVNTEDELVLPVQIGDKEVAGLIRPEKARQTNPRAFEYVLPMEADEEAILLSLSILQMVKGTNKV